MRFTFIKGLIVAAAALLCVGASAQNKTNPFTGIAWPANCNASGTVAYNFLTNTCFPAGSSVAPIIYRGVWSSTTTYAKNDAVAYGGNQYISLQASNLNQNPATATTFWALLLSNGSVTSIVPSATVTCTPLISGKCTGDITLTSAAGGSTPGGPSLAWQFNNGGSLGGTSAVATDSTAQAILLTATNPAIFDFPNITTGPASTVLGIHATYTGANSNPSMVNNTIDDSQTGWSYGNVANLSAAGPWAVAKGQQDTANFYSPGINNQHANISNGYSVGDYQGGGYYGYGFCDGGAISASDEGCTGETLHDGQNTIFMIGTASTGATTGTQSLPIVNTNRVVSAKAYVLDVSAATITGSITGNRAQIGTTGLYAFPISATVTPSTAYGPLTCGGSGLIQPNPGGSSANASCTANSIAGTSGSGFANGKACLASAFPEQVIISNVTAISGASQTMTITYRNPHRNPATNIPNHLFQGGPCGQFYVTDLSKAMPQHFGTSYNIFGATDSSHLVMGCAQLGGLNNCTSLGFVTPLAITNLSKSGTTVTATVGGSVPLFNLQATALIASCSDASLNGTVTNVTNPTPTILQWTQSGGGSTCPTATISLPIMNSFKAYWGAEAVQTQTGAAPCTTACTIPLEPNSVPWASGHAIEQPLHYTYMDTGRWLISQSYNINNLGFQEGDYQIYQGEGKTGTGGFQPELTILQDPNDPCVLYKGCGGYLDAPSQWVHKTGSALAGTVYDYPPMNGGALTLVGCAENRLGACNLTTQDLALFQMQGGFTLGTVTSWAITGGNTLTVNFTNPGVTLNPLGGQHFSLGGFAEPYLNHTFLINSATSTSVVATLIQANASATETGNIVFNGFGFRGARITWNPDLARLTIPGELLANSISTASLNPEAIHVGDTNAAGAVYFRRNLNSDAASIQLGNLFSADNYLCVNTAETGCIDPTDQTYTPSGTLGALTLEARGTAQMNNLAISQGTPTNLAQGTYVGTAGTTDYQYLLLINSPDGTQGSFGNGFSKVSAAAATLDSSHHILQPCPAALQLGMTAGSTYELISVNLTSNVVYDVGPCAVGTTVNDIGAGTPISIPVAPYNGIGGWGTAYVNPHGSIRFLATQSSRTAFDVAFSNPSAGKMSCDSSTIGDGLCNLIVGLYSTSANCSSVASPAVCGAAPAGQVQVAAAATTLQINTTAVTANSRVGCLAYSTAGITPPSNLASLLPPSISAITPGTSFTLAIPVAPATSPVNVQYCLIN